MRARGLDSRRHLGEHARGNRMLADRFPACYAVTRILEHFFECILQDSEPLVNGEDGRRSLEIALAAERSIGEDRPVPLPLLGAVT